MWWTIKVGCVRGERGRVLSLLVAVGLSAVLVTGCATQGSPRRGEQDKRGPRVLGVEPPTESVRLRPDAVVFTFDEYLQPREVDKGVFIAPPPGGRAPQVYVAGKRLVVRFNRSELSERTYVITLGPGIKDFTEGNSIPQTLQYAFSPGAVIDTCSLAGRVMQPYTQLPAGGYIVAAFDPDSVARRGLHQLKPLMAAQTDTAGYFQISYLRPGSYVIFGFQDKDNSFTWNQRGEAVAQDPDSVVVIGAGEQKRDWELFAFVNDTITPRVRRVETVNRRSLRVELSEPVVSGRVVVGDDTFAITPDAAALFTDSKQSELQLFLSRAVADSFTVKLSGLVDTVGNALAKDTTVQVKLRRTGEFKRVLEVVRTLETKDPYEVGLLFNTRIVADSAARHVYVIDSARKRVAGVGVRTAGSQVTVRLPAELEPEMPLKLVIDTLLTSIDSLRPAKRLRYDVKYPRADQFGSLELTIASAQRDLLVVLTDEANPKEPQLYRSTRLNLPYLKPGTYRVSVVEDADGNGRWTPGRVWPKRLNETVYHYRGTILVRGGWSQQLKLTYPDPAAEAGR